MPRHLWVLFAIGAAWTLQLVWVVSPVDPIADVLPIIGWLDDLASLAMTSLFTFVAAASLAREGRRRLPGPARSVVAEYRPLSAEDLAAL